MADSNVVDAIEVVVLSVMLVAVDVSVDTVLLHERNEESHQLSGDVIALSDSIDVIVTGNNFIISSAALKLLLEQIQVGLEQEHLHIRSGAIRISRRKTGLRRVLGVRSEDDGIHEEDLESSLGARNVEHLRVEVVRKPPTVIGIERGGSVLDLSERSMSTIVVMVSEDEIPWNLGRDAVVDILVVGLPKRIIDASNSTLIEVVAKHDKEAGVQLSSLGSHGLSNFHLLESDARLRLIGGHIVSPVTVEEEGELLLSLLVLSLLVLVLSRHNGEAGGGEEDLGEHGKRSASKERYPGCCKAADCAVEGSSAAGPTEGSSGRATAPSERISVRESNLRGSRGPDSR